MATTEENKDPYADIRNLLYRQKPETREAEIRAEKNRAKATAFLQAFGTIADAFTLSRGGDVTKRDANPYIMNNMQKADAYREQDRADKKAWENSWLNLQNNIAQYNIRQQDWEKQKAREDEMLERQQAHQVKMAHIKYMDDMDERMDNERVQNERDDKRYAHEKEIAKIAGGYKESVANIAGEYKMNAAGIQATNRMALQEARARINENVLRIKQEESKPDFKLFMKIPNPENPSEFLGIDRNAALLIFARMQASSDDSIRPKAKRSGSYDDNEIIAHTLRVLQEHPELTPLYLDKLYSTVVGTQPGSGQSGTTNPTVPTVPTVPADTVQKVDVNKTANNILGI